MGAVATEEHSHSPGQGSRRRGPGDASQGMENGFGDKRTRNSLLPHGAVGRHTWSGRGTLKSMEEWLERAPQAMLPPGAPQLTSYLRVLCHSLLSLPVLFLALF